MLTPILVFVLLFVGTLCKEDVICVHREMEECREIGVPSTKVPRTKAGMDVMCRQVISIAKCVKAGRETCGGDEDTDDDVRYLKRLISYLETEVCNEDSNVYRAISENLPCIADTLPLVREECSGERMEAKKNTIIRFINSYLLEGNGDTELLPGCTYLLYSFACAATTLGEACGAQYSEVYADVMANADYGFLDHCPPEVIGMLPDAVEALKSIKEAEERVEAAFKRRRNTQDLTEGILPGDKDHHHHHHAHSHKHKHGHGRNHGDKHGHNHSHKHHHHKHGHHPHHKHGRNRGHHHGHGHKHNHHHGHEQDIHPHGHGKEHDYHHGHVKEHVYHGHGEHGYKREHNYHHGHGEERDYPHGHEQDIHHNGPGEEHDYHLGHEQELIHHYGREKEHDYHHGHGEHDYQHGYEREHNYHHGYEQDIHPHGHGKEHDYPHDHEQDIHHHGHGKEHVYHHGHEQDIHHHGHEEHDYHHGHEQEQIHHHGQEREHDYYHGHGEHDYKHGYEREHNHHHGHEQEHDYKYGLQQEHDNHIGYENNFGFRHEHMHGQEQEHTHNPISRQMYNHYQYPQHNSQYLDKSSETTKFQNYPVSYYEYKQSIPTNEEHNQRINFEVDQGNNHFAKYPDVRQNHDDNHGQQTQFGGGYNQDRNVYRQPIIQTNGGYSSEDDLGLKNNHTYQVYHISPAKNSAPNYAHDQQMNNNYPNNLNNINTYSTLRNNQNVQVSNKPLSPEVNEYVPRSRSPDYQSNVQNNYPNNLNSINTYSTRRNNQNLQESNKPLSPEVNEDVPRSRSPDQSNVEQYSNQDKYNSSRNRGPATAQRLKNNSTPHKNDGNSEKLYLDSLERSGAVGRLLKDEEAIIDDFAFH